MAARGPKVADPLRSLLICLGLVGCVAAEESTLPAVDITSSGPVEVAGVPGQSLHLARYEIAPMTDLRPHFHDGTQIGIVISGILTYTVLTGSVTVYQRGADGKPERIAEIAGGQTRRVPAGQWVVEHADTTHFGANRDDIPLVIVTSSLLRAGAPLATPVSQ
jgi:quercetin dioxygenase-like cupin family protein